MVDLLDIQRGVDRHIPEHCRDGVLEYVLHGRPVGSFLEAVFSNEFMGACARADDVNRLALFEYAVFLHNYAPSDAYGSPERVQAWIERGGLFGPDDADGFPRLEGTER